MPKASAFSGRVVWVLAPSQCEGAGVKGPAPRLAGGSTSPSHTHPLWPAKLAMCSFTADYYCNPSIN